MLNAFAGGRLKTAEKFLLLSVVLLLLIYSLPNLMAVQKTLIFTAALFSFKVFWNAFLQKEVKLKAVVGIFFALHIWMIFVALFFSSDVVASLSEWKGQWLPTSLSFFIGMSLAITIMRARFDNPVSVVALVILIPLSAFVFIHDLVVLWNIISKKTFYAFEYGYGITDHRATIGYVITLIEPLLIADVLRRVSQHDPFLKIPSWLAASILALSFFALIAATARNGLLILILAFVLASIIMLTELRKVYTARRIFTFSMVALVFLSAFLLIFIKSDSRWQNFIETIPVAWDIDRDTLWLKSDTLWLSKDRNLLPITSSGQPVELSAYSRIAWAHEGWRMLLDHPWGTEISRYSFQKLVLEKYGTAGMAHSHNSWIDFGLNVGFLGLLLWAGFLFMLARMGWREWKQYGQPMGMALFLLTLLFSIRGFLDSIFRDHIIGQFMLVAGLMVGALSYRRSILNDHEHKN
jgi:O-antigen ligase